MPVYPHSFRSTAGNYDLLTTVLRNEWGYTGIVMTDWWAKANDEGQPASFQNTAAMVRAQNDLYMVTGDSLSNSNEDNSMEKLVEGSVFRSEYVRSAANICRFLLQSPAYLRMVGKETDLDRELQRLAEQEKCLGLITGESIGQVASQTMQALCVTDSVVNRPIFRPCIGMDKEEIVQIARAFLPLRAAFI